MRVRSHFLREVAGLGFAQVVVGVCGIVLISLLSRRLSHEGLGLFFVSRSAIAVVASIVLLGFDVAVPRFVGMARGQAGQFLTAALVPVSLFGLIVVVTAALYPTPSSQLVFHSPDHGFLLLMVAIHCLAFPLHAVMYAYFRGLRSVRLVSTVWILYALFPVLVAPFVDRLGSTDTQRLAGFFAITALLTLLLAIVSRARASLRWAWSTEHFGQLMRYGVPRIPSSFLLSTTVRMSIFLAPYIVNLSAAGVLGANLALLSFLEQAVNPMSLVLLPMVAELVGQRSKEGLKQVAASVVPFAWHLALAMSLMLPGLLPDITVLWVGSETASRPVAAIIAVGAGWNMAYVILRGVLNAVTARPLITYMTLVSAILSCGLGILLGKAYGSVGLALATFIALTWLGLASVWLAYRYLESRVAVTDLSFSGCIVLAAGVVMGADWLVNQTTEDLIVGLTVKIVLRSFAVVALAWVAGRMGVPWWHAVTSRIQFGSHRPRETE